MTTKKRAASQHIPAAFRADAAAIAQAALAAARGNLDRARVIVAPANPDNSMRTAINDATLALNRAYKRMDAFRARMERMASHEGTHDDR